MINGCDISYWQSTTPLTGFDFIIARATYTATQDARWPFHRDNVIRAGRVLGAYAFGTVHNTAAAQAAAFIKAVGRSTRVVALDMEPESHDVDWAPEPVWDEMSDAEGAAFIKLVKAQGYYTGLYHSESGFPELGQDFDWVAHWGVSEPTRHHLFHQYRGSPLDLDHFDGTLDQLRALALFGGDVVNNYSVPKVPSQMMIAKGTILYHTSDCNTTSGDKIIDPGRNMPYCGQPFPGVHAVEYVGTDGVHTGLAWFTKTPGLITPVPVPTKDCTAEIKAATDPLNATIAAQSETIAGEPARTQAAIDADRAKAHVVVSYE